MPRIGPDGRIHHGPIPRRPGNGHRYRQAQKRQTQLEPYCAQCGHDGTPDPDTDRPNPLTADHVIPIARGGHPDGPRRTLCRDCNSRRRDTPLDEDDLEPYLERDA